MSIFERLTHLRKLMEHYNIDYYFIPNSDAHQNEYLPEASKRYQYLSGFTGSNAEILVGRDKAFFWTDGRYAEQAAQELPADLFTIFIFKQAESSSLQAFISESIRKARIGVDPQIITLRQAEALRTASHLSDSELVFLTPNLIDQIWLRRPALYHSKISVLSEQHAGQSAQEKLIKLQDYLRAEKQEAIVLNDLASIAWLFNLRGTDIVHNPVFLSYALITTERAILFVNLSSLPQKTQDYLKALHIETRDYPHFYKLLPELCPPKVLLDKTYSNEAIYNALKSHKITASPSPILLWKACKNEIEIEGAAQAHRLDALALIRFFSWLDHHKTGHTELSLVDKLLSFRELAKSFQGTSFETILGYGAHGAIIHYRSTPKTNIAVGTDEILLLDSGGQYLEGTTDVTRTIHLGQPTDFEKRCYTLVLKGHLALKRSLFPAGTRGEQLDILARQFLWQEGLNYGHGTGHGVGSFLCVHEGPQRISTAATTTALQPNMILSNEPGVYLSGRLGIRIENLVYVKKSTPPHSEFGEFYTFEDLTLVPYSRKLIAKEMLSSIEIAQVNAYHARILAELGASLEVETLKWLIEATKAI